MLSNKLNLLLEYNRLYPIQGVTILIACLLFFVIKFLGFYKNKNRDYKIYSFTKNFSCILVYIIFFFCLLLYIRFLRLGITIDLLELYCIFKELFYKLPLAFSLMFLEMFFILLLLISHAKRYLHREIIKYYLYLKYSTSYKDNLISNIQVFINSFIDKLSSNWSYPFICRKLIHYVVLKSYCNLLNKEDYPLRLKYSAEIILNYTPLALLFYFIFYDYVYNNAKLYFVFYYLIFYFLFILWENATTFLHYTDNEYNVIVYERYYAEDYILYVGTTREDDTKLLNYITGNFKDFQFDETLSIDKRLALSIFPLIFRQKYRYIKTANPNIYVNPFTNDVCDITAINIDEIYK